MRQPKIGSSLEHQDPTFSNAVPPPTSHETDAGIETFDRATIRRFPSMNASVAWQRVSAAHPEPPSSTLQGAVPTGAEPPPSQQNALGMAAAAAAMRAKEKRAAAPSSSSRPQPIVKGGADAHDHAHDHAHEHTHEGEAAGGDHHPLDDGHEHGHHHENAPGVVGGVVVLWVGGLVLAGTVLVLVLVARPLCRLGVLRVISSVRGPKPEGASK